MAIVEFLNCCPNPDIKTIKSVFEGAHDEEALKKCNHCGVYWFFRFHEYWDDYTTWHTKITDEEAETILQNQDRRKLNLAYLCKRESIRWEDGEVTVTKGQPGDPFIY